MILADTSAWVEYDRATGSPVDLRMVDLVSKAELAVTEPVLMEVLAGARDDDREQQLTAMLNRYPLRRIEPTVDFTAAATVYRRCRRAGITPRGLIDCLIAAVAQRHGDHLLAHDAGMRRVAEVIGLPLDPASS